MKKIYVEITNICNLSCAFCPGTKRARAFMEPDTFEVIAGKIKPYTDYVYLHLMGEPLLHKDLSKIIDIARGKGLKVCITTNGTLLKNAEEALGCGEKLHKISISLQAQEANVRLAGKDEYLETCFEFGQKAGETCIVAYRLWNEGGANSGNAHIMEVMERYFPKPWSEHQRGYKLCKNVYLERGEVFDWPELPGDASAENATGLNEIVVNDINKKPEPRFCYGLRDQLGILVDGTVVPCCLDHNGDIPLGNILTEELCDIINSDRAQEIYNGFSGGKAVEELCKNCGYATRFN